MRTSQRSYSSRAARPMTHHKRGLCCRMLEIVMRMNVLVYESSCSPLSLVCKATTCRQVLSCSAACITTTSPAASTDEQGRKQSAHVCFAAHQPTKAIHVSMLVLHPQICGHTMCIAKQPSGSHLPPCTGRSHSYSLWAAAPPATTASWAGRASRQS